MTCPLADACLAPSCRPGGRLWCAKSSSAANLKAFDAEVIAYMQMTGRRDAGKACAQVYRAAMKDVERECLFG